MSRALYELLFSNTVEGLSVNLVIYVLFVIGCVAVARLRRALSRERHYLTLVQGALKQSNAKGETANVTSLWDLRERTGLTAADPGKVPASAIGARIHAIWAARGAGREVAAEIGAVYEARQGIAEELPRYFTSVLVLLGLAGTVWGLRGIITQLNKTLSAASTDPNSLIQALEPMRSAFSCTLAGIVTSILLAFFLNRLDATREAITADTEETLILQVMPLVFPVSEAAQLDKVAAVLESSQRFLEDFGHTLTQSRDFFAETLSGAVRGAAQELQSTLAGATQALQGSLDGMQGTAAALTESAQSLMKYREELAAERQRSQEYLRESARHLGILGEAVLEPLQAAAAELSASRSAIEMLATVSQQDRQEQREQASAVIEELRTVTRNVAEERIAIGEMASHIHDALDRTAEQMQSALDKPVQSLALRLQESASDARRVAQTLEEFMNRIRPETLSLPNGELLGNALSQVAEGLGAVTGRAESTGNQVKELVSRLDALTPRLETLATNDGRHELQEMLNLNKQILATLDELMRANLTEVRQMRSYLQEPLWRHMVGPRGGKNGT